MHGSGTTTLINSNEEMNYIMKILQALEGSNILLKRVTKTIKNKTKKQKGGFLSMLLGTLEASLLGELLAGKRIVRAGLRNKKGKGIVRAGSGKQWNFEIQKYYQNEPRFNSVFSRNNFPKEIKEEAYVINFDEYADVDTHWITLFCKRNEIVYFDSFAVEHVPVEIK